MAEGLYRRKNGAWVMDVVINGERCVRTFDRAFTFEEAKALAGKARHDIVTGNAGIRKPKNIGFDTAADLFLEHSKTNHKRRTVRYHEQTIKNLRAEFGGKSLAEITTFSVETYKRKRSIKAKVRVNREISVLKALFNRMIEWKKFSGSNPVVGVKKLIEDKRRIRFLTHEEEARLLAACKEPLRTILILGIHCGLRIEAEALTLRWSAVDLPRQTLTVTSENAKTHRIRTIPTNDTVIKALEAMRDRTLYGSEDHVFLNRRGQPFGSIRNIFEAARGNAGLAKDVSLHTMRHTFASRLVMAGESLRTVQVLGGWSSLAMLERYAHLSDQHLRDAVAKLDQPREAVVRSVGTREGNRGVSGGTGG